MATAYLDGSKEAPVNSHRHRNVAANAPIICAAIKGSTAAGAIPANVSVRERAIVTAGLAKDVEAVNQ